MSTTFEAPAQYERDLRSASKGAKRSKDAAAKWSFGARPAPGVKLPLDEDQKANARPLRKNSDMSGSHTKGEHNIIKMRGDWNMPPSRVRGKISALEELNETSRSITDLLPTPAQAKAGYKQSFSDNVLYNFDRSDSPGKPLALDIFVKTTGRETERLVEKEYEVLDGNGETLKGRKARRNLRMGASDAADGETNDEVDGFELV